MSTLTMRRWEHFIVAGSASARADQFTLIGGQVMQNVFEQRVRLPVEGDHILLVNEYVVSLETDPTLDGLCCLHVSHYTIIIGIVNPPT